MDIKVHTLLLNDGSNITTDCTGKQCHHCRDLAWQAKISGRDVAAFLMCLMVDVVLCLGPGALITLLIIYLYQF